MSDNIYKWITVTLMSISLCIASFTLLMNLGLFPVP